MAKFLIFTGIGFITLGCLLYFRKQIPGFGWVGHLPGDINIQHGNMTFSFPIVTCLVLSVALSVILRVVGRWF